MLRGHGLPDGNKTTGDHSKSGPNLGNDSANRFMGVGIRSLAVKININSAKTGDG